MPGVTTTPARMSPLGRRWGAGLVAAFLAAAQLLWGSSPATAADNGVMKIIGTGIIPGVPTGSTLDGVSARFAGASSPLFCCAPNGGLSSDAVGLFGLQTSNPVPTSRLTANTWQAVTQPSSFGAGTSQDPYTLQSTFQRAPFSVVQTVQQVANSNQFVVVWRVGNTGNTQASYRPFHVADLAVNDGTSTGATGTGEVTTLGNGADRLTATMADGTVISLTEDTSGGAEAWRTGGIGETSTLTAPLTSSATYSPSSFTTTPQDIAAGVQWEGVTINPNTYKYYRVIYTVTAPPTPAAPTVGGVPSGTVPSRSVTATFSSPGDPATVGYQCKLDNESYSGCATTLTMSGLKTGQHTFSARGVNSAGITGPEIVKNWIIGTGPSAPTGLTVDPIESGALVTYDLPSDPSVAYFEYSLDGTTWTELNDSPVDNETKLQGYVLDLVNGTPYTFRLRAVDVDDARSSIVSRQVTPVGDPDKPADVQVTNGDGSATFTFAEPAGNGSPITKYQYIYLSGTSWADLPSTTVQGQVTATLPDVPNGLTLSYFLRSVSAAGASGGTLVQVSPYGVPAEVLALRLEPGNASVDGEFNAPDYDGGSAVTSYQYRIDEGDWVTLPAQGSGGSFSIDGLTNGTTYTIAVRAGNARGYGFEVSQEVVPGLAPEAPTQVTARPDDASALVTFLPGDDHGSAVSEYQVRAVTGDISSIDEDLGYVAVPTTSAPGGKRSLVVRNLTNATTYSVQVRAKNDIGTGEGSEPVTVRPLALPGAPADFAASSGDGKATLAWRTPRAGGAVEGWQLSRDNGQTWVSVQPTSPITGRFSLAVNGLTNGTAYNLAVRAVNATGAGPSSPVRAVTPYAAPVVSGVTATAGVASVTATWPAATPGNRVAGYLVSAVPGPATCETNDAAATSCVLGATAGETYRVVVRTKGSNGTVSAETAPSNAVTATSPPVPPAPPTVDPSLPLTTSEGSLQEAAPGQQITFRGSGFAPYSTATLVVYSTPRVLGTAVTDADGAFSVEITVPTDLPAGDHTFVASGVDAEGQTRALTLPVSVAKAEAAQNSRGGGGSTLPKTGSDPTVLVSVAFGLLLSGVALHLSARRKTITSRR